MRSINQVRHPYVVLGVKEPDGLSTKGDIAVVHGTDTLSFKYMSPGGMETSDIINTNNILSASLTLAAKMNIKLNKKKVALKAGKTPIAGQEYIVKVIFYNYAGAGDDNYTVKYGMTVADSSTNATTLYKALADSLNKNLKDLVPLAGEVTSDATGLYIPEVLQDWVLGVKPVTVTRFEVSTLPIVENGIETGWSEVTVEEGSAYSNGRKMADLEWFHIGARGDMYRGFGHPHGVKTETVLTDYETSYDTLDIHYAYVGPNEGVQKSEKTITLIAETDVMKTLIEEMPAFLNLIYPEDPSEDPSDEG